MWLFNWCALVAGEGREGEQRVGDYEIRVGGFTVIGYKVMDEGIGDQV